MEPKSDRRKELPREVYADSKTWHHNYRLWIQGWRYLIGAYGLNAGVYTQISDVEHELNGWMTYDRAVSKIPEAELRRLHQPLYGAPAAARRTLLAPAGGRAASEPLTRTVELREVPKDLALVCYNTPGTVNVMINGRQVMSVDNRGTRQGVGVSVVPLPPHAMGELRPGANSITLRAESPKEIPTLDFALIELAPLHLTAP